MACERRICPGWAALHRSAAPRMPGARIAAVGRDCLRRVEADGEASVVPGRALDPDRGRHGVASPGEGNEEGSASRLHLEPAVPPDDRSRRVGRRAMGFAEQERDDSRRLSAPPRAPQRREPIRGGELGVLLQDLPLEPPERGARVDAELVDHHVPCLLVGPQSVGLPSRPIQREHELSTEVLAKWALRDQALELRHRLLVPAVLELQLDPLLLQREPERLEPGRFLGSECVVPKLGQRLPAEQGDRLSKLVPPGQAVAGPGDGCDRVHAPDVQLVPFEQPQAVSGRLGLDSLAPEGLPQSGHVTLERSLRCRRRPSVPEPFHELVRGDGSVRVKQQKGKERPALRAGGRDVDPVRSRLEPAEQPEVHLVLIVARRRRAALAPR